MSKVIRVRKKAQAVKKTKKRKEAKALKQTKIFIVTKFLLHRALSLRSPRITASQP